MPSRMLQGRESTRCTSAVKGSASLPVESRKNEIVAYSVTAGPGVKPASGTGALRVCTIAEGKYSWRTQQDIRHMPVPVSGQNDTARSVSANRVPRA